MVAITVRLLDEYHIGSENRCRILVDGANPSFIRSPERPSRRRQGYEQQIAYYKKDYPSVYDLEILQLNMFVLPVSFAKEDKHMLARCKEMI
jgi:hypothetical protein